MPQGRKEISDMTSCTPVFVLVGVSSILVELVLLIASARAMRNGANEGVGSALSANILSFLALCATANLIWKNVFCSDDPSGLTTRGTIVAGASFLLWAGSTFLLIWRLWPKRVVQYGQDTMAPLVDGVESVFQVTRQGNTLIVTLSTGEADFHREFRAVLDADGAVRWNAAIDSVLGGAETAEFSRGKACAMFIRTDDGVVIEAYNADASHLRTVAEFTDRQARELQDVVKSIIRPLAA